MTDTDMTRPAADDHPKDTEHAPAVEPMQAGEPNEQNEQNEQKQGGHDDAEVDQTGGKVANPYLD